MAIDHDDITFEERPTRGRYSFRIGNDEAFMSLSMAGKHLVIIDHTQVPSAFRGMGVGQALVARAVADARAAGKKVLPLCPFAAAQFRRHADWADVLEGRKMAQS